MFYLIEDEEFFQLLYADDFLWLVPAEVPLGPIAMVVFFLTALGVPWGWKGSTPGWGVIPS